MLWVSAMAAAGSCKRKSAQYEKMDGKCNVPGEPRHAVALYEGLK
jgi:hypothetical protein